jgi:hypothetical protein
MEQTPQFNKPEFAAEIGHMESELAQKEMTLKELDSQWLSAKGNRMAGIIALLIAILGFLFLSSLWYVWGFVGLIGLPTFFVALSAKNWAEREKKTISPAIADLRGKLAEKRALLAML